MISALEIENVQICFFISKLTLWYCELHFETFKKSHLESIYAVFSDNYL